MKLITLGRLGLEGGELTRQKPLLLLAYLAVEGAKPRRHLAELFFSETSDPLNSLSRALSHLRKEAPGLIEADQKRAWTLIESDATQFLAHADRAELESCEASYGGAFAEDLDLELSPELEEWVLGTREYLAGRQRDVLLRLGEARLAGKKGEQAASYAERAYTLTGAAELEPEHLVRVYLLLVAGNSPKASEVREEAEAFGVALPTVESVAAHSGVEAAHNLPLPKSSFVGRDAELLEIAAQLATPDCRLLTLHGTGGIGKSRLALQAAYEAAETGQFKDGVTFVPLDALTSADLIPSSLAEALSLTLSGQDDTLTQVIRFLGDKHSLLLLDNFEHLMDGATLPAKLLESCPNLKIIVTSRERLRLEQEWVLTLSGLAVPEDEDVEGGLEQLQNYDALNLFVQRAKRTRLDFSLTDDDLPHALKICQLVDGFPLGIELAAVWVKVLPLHEISSEIEKNVDILAGSSRNVPERQQSIRAVFEHSWNLLTKQEQDTLMKLSVFVGGFRREAAAEVAEATLPILASLVDKSLLRVTANGRYDRHPLLYQFEREKLPENSDIYQCIRKKHMRAYITLLQKAARSYGRGWDKDYLAKLDEEIGNIGTAWKHVLQAFTIDDLQAFRYMQTYFDRRALFREGKKFFEALENLSSILHIRIEDRLHAKAISRVSQGWFLHRLGDQELARTMAEQTIELAAQLSKPELELDAWDTLGAICAAERDYQSAKLYYTKAMQRSEKDDDTSAYFGLMNNLASIEQVLGNYEVAEQMQINLIDYYAEIGDQFRKVALMNNLGDLYLQLDKPAMSKQTLHEALEIAKHIDYRALLLPLTVNLSLACIKLGDYNLAFELANNALISEHLIDPYTKSIVLSVLGWSSLYLDISDKALYSFQQGIGLAMQLDDHYVFYDSAIGIAGVLTAKCRFTESYKLIEYISHSCSYDDLVQKLEQVRSNFYLDYDYVSSQLNGKESKVINPKAFQEAEDTLRLKYEFVTNLLKSSS